MDLSALRADMPVTETCTYLNHAAVGPVPLTVAAAAAEPGNLQSADPQAMNAELAKRSADARARAARLYGATPERIAFVGNTSHGLSLIANGLDWREGDNIVVSDQEFPSNYLPWLAQTAHGVAPRDLPVANGRLTPEALASTIDTRTRVVAISHVQFHNGFRADIAGLADVARRHDALVVVDGTQSIGAMEFDLDGWGADALVFSAHKWMLCPKGIGMMLLSERALDRVGVTVAGWQSVNDRFAFHRTLDFLPSAARFESGTENAPGRFAIAKRLEDIEAFGPRAIAARVIALRDRVADGLARAGWDVTSPDGANERSGIVTARHDRHDATEIVAALEAEGIRTSARGGALRISAHAYNTEDEVDLLLAALG